jgi:hypothetical protein
MPEGNGGYDWRERIRRLEDSIKCNCADHDRMDRNLDRLHTSILAQKKNIDKLLGALRDLIDRILPQSLS